MTTRKAIPKSKRLEVFNKCNGHCAYCGCKLEYKDMQVDHIKSIRRNGSDMTDEEMNDISNLLPSCRQCNFYKSTFTLEEFRDRLSGVLMDNLRKNFNYRLAVKHGIVKEEIKPIKFYFEK